MGDFLTAARAEPGGVWELPADASCASRARSLVDAALTSMRLDREAIREAKLMVSELATNALQHADGHEPHELWISFARDAVICAIFDTLPPEEFSGDPTFSGDHGRGLAIVRELSDGHWGLTATRSRLRPGVTGKVVWFACPLADTADTEAGTSALEPAARR